MAVENQVKAAESSTETAITVADMGTVLPIAGRKIKKSRSEKVVAKDLTAIKVREKAMMEKVLTVLRAKVKAMMEVKGHGERENRHMGFGTNHRKNNPPEHGH